jgi:hypothetical protein
MRVSTSIYTSGAWSSALRDDLDSPSTVVFAFGAAQQPGGDAPFADIRRAFPRSHLVGCSTAGEIHGTSVLDGSVTLAAVRFDRTRARVASEPVSRATSFQAGERLGRALAGPALRAVLVFGDGTDVNGSQLAEGLRSVTGRVPISGGLAGDGTRFKRTWVLADGRPRPATASALGLYGDAVRVGHGSKGGWDKFGPERRITRSRGNVLHELDGRPALELYKSYLGELAAGLPATALLFPLAIRPSRDADEPLVRTVLAHSEDDQSLTFAGDDPEGSFAQLMRANFDRLVDAAASAAEDALSCDARLCLAISCVGRRLILGQRAEEETEAVAEMLPGCAITGFYSYGEISPSGAADCKLHNQTMTLTTIGED